ncbi:Hypothetical_protein [Hexamita inflata]|uniref:Hypothetical_protein n=1 Tax=Hexamita inflata TaxID=28002 RepID=A0AA86QSV4_9EUKA|nr:Hypothetical protein HINF_LOCUS51665 [Hexamita inflata]
MLLTLQEQEKIISAVNELQPQLQSLQNPYYQALQLGSQFWQQIGQMSGTQQEHARVFYLNTHCVQFFKQLPEKALKLEILLVISEHYEQFESELDHQWLLKYFLPFHPVHVHRFIQQFLNAVYIEDKSDLSTLIQKLQNNVEIQIQAEIVQEVPNKKEPVTAAQPKEPEKEMIKEAPLRETKNENGQKILKQRVQEFRENVDNVKMDHVEMKNFLKTLVKECVQLKEKNNELKRKCQSVVRHANKLNSVYK